MKFLILTSLLLASLANAAPGAGCADDVIGAADKIDKHKEEIFRKIGDGGEKILVFENGQRVSGEVSQADGKIVVQKADGTYSNYDPVEIKGVETPDSTKSIGADAKTGVRTTKDKVRKPPKEPEPVPVPKEPEVKVTQEEPEPATPPKDEVPAKPEEPKPQTYAGRAKGDAPLPNPPEELPGYRDFEMAMNLEMTTFGVGDISEIKYERPAGLEDPSAVVATEFPSRNKNPKRLDLDFRGNRKGKTTYVVEHPKSDGKAVRIFDPDSVPDEAIPILTMRETMGSQYLSNEGLPVLVSSTDVVKARKGMRVVDKLPDNHINYSQVQDPPRITQAQWEKNSAKKYSPNMLSPDSAEALHTRIDELKGELQKRDGFFKKFFGGKLREKGIEFGQVDPASGQFVEKGLDIKNDQFALVKLTDKEFKALPEKLKHWVVDLEFGSHKGKLYKYLPKFLNNFIARITGKGKKKYLISNFDF